MELLSVMSADWFKARRTGNLWISIAVPVLITLFVFFIFIRKGMGYAPVEAGTDMWLEFAQILFTMYAMLLPMIVAVIAFNVSNIEHKNNGLKQLFTLPVRKTSLYFSKVGLLMIYLVVLLVLSLGLMLLTGSLLGRLFPNLGFTAFDQWAVVGAFFIRLLTGLTALLAIHYFLSMYWNNFVVSVGIAVFLLVIGAAIASWEFGYLLPYCSIIRAMGGFLAGSTDIFNADLLLNLVWAGGFFFFGYRLMMRRSVA